MLPDSDPLAQLRDIALPDGVSWWPLAPGWWLLLTVVILVLLGVRQWNRKKNRGHWRKEALSELQTIRNLAAASGKDTQVLEKSSALFRRVAIAIEGRESVSSLTGKEWLEKLDRISRSREFTQGVGRLLETIVWQKSNAVDANDIDQLMTLLEDFIKTGSVHNEADRKVIKEGRV